ncbi:putative membrane protein YesL [Thalassobacillus devorans]|nr:YesL family protein [Thalassobacillus devorans]NIK28578.1 putative membrane protein YesL [Thalassobacillus devorans]
MFDRFGSFFVECCQWIWRIMMLNWIWFIHVLLGGIVMGIFPSTIALFSTTRLWLKGDLDQPLWPHFHQTFKREFMRVNGLGWIYLAVGLFIALNIYLVSQLQGFFSLLCMFALLLSLVMYLFSFLYFFSYYVHFRQSFRGYLIQPFIIMLISFKQNLMIGIGLSIVGYLLYNLPGLIPFAVGVMPAFWIMKVSLNRFKHLYWHQPEVEGGVSK